MSMTSEFVVVFVVTIAKTCTCVRLAVTIQDKQQIIISVSDWLSERLHSLPVRYPEDAPGHPALPVYIRVNQTIQTGSTSPSRVNHG